MLEALITEVNPRTYGEQFIIASINSCGRG